MLAGAFVEQSDYSLLAVVGPYSVNSIIVGCLGNAVPVDLELKNYFVLGKNNPDSNSILQ